MYPGNFRDSGWSFGPLEALRKIFFFEKKKQKTFIIEGITVPYVYANVDSLVTTPPKKNVGSGQCVALIEAFTNVPRPAKDFWKAGAAVRGNAALAKGTAIATFTAGRYPSNAAGNHAAFYLSQDPTGIWVVDQYASSNGIHKRHLRFKGKSASGFVDPSNNGDAFSVIE
jgi:hypothetical protein